MAERLAAISADPTAFARTPSRAREYIAQRPLPVWNDDDLQILMSATREVLELAPTQARQPQDSEAGSSSLLSTEDWSTTARRAAERASNPEAAATALERLAERVRAGELQLTIDPSGLNDVAALATALLALVSFRR